MARQGSLELTALTRAYLDELRVRGYKPKTIQGYAAKLGRFTRWAATTGATQLCHFDADRVKRYVTYLQNEQRWATHPNLRVTPQPLISPVAIRNYVRDLKTFATWLAQEQYTAANVLAEVRKPKADETPIEPFSDDELQRLFAALDPTDVFDLRDYVISHTLWDTGMRVGELVGLTLEDVDLKSCQIRIQHAKFGKWRDIGFGTQTHKYLTRYLTLGRPQPATAGEEHFFLAYDGYPLQEGTLQRMCFRLSQRTGVHIHCHRFRHTFAVQMLRAGTDLRTLQRLMGHADIRILARYLNLASDEAIRAHQSNSPADRHHHLRQTNTRRLPLRRAPHMRP